MTFPNFKGKHAHDSVFSAKDYLKYNKKRWKPFLDLSPKGVIITYQRQISEYAEKKYRPKKLKLGLGCVYMFKSGVALFHCYGIGSPVAVTKVEEFIAAGITHIMNVGSCGGLQKKRKIGDFIICNKAIRDEGTSHHYLPKGKYSYATPKMTEALKKSMGKNKHYVGTTWTIDTPYRETVQEVKHYRKEGVETVEMEASALFALAKARKISIGALLVISDKVHEGEWDPKMKSKQLHNRLIQAFEISKNALESVL